ncbi:MAG: 2-dehydro-3-deoxyphosphogluconate aldolase [Lentisphaerae bacterium GWF2_44_16]|nr:MAG: 2-dehydro-3-deoxyphosphogluconate aldolase [Lentisphaerae bacterium GWF2_44_16]
MSDIFREIGELGIVPVVKIDNPEHAVPLAKALTAGGLPVAEITFRTAAAEESIRRISSEMPDVLVGAGTVLSIEQAEKAKNAGAKFVVSPGLNPKVVAYCMEKKLPIVPGVCNPSDIEMALEAGLKVVKFFPAESFGGLKTLKALSAPYGDLKFMPTGGIDATNINEYLAFDKVVACGGSWMVKPEFLKEENFAKITELTQQAVTGMLGFDLGHIGINAPDAETSLKTAKTFSSIFNMPLKEGNSSNFAGTLIEVNKGSGLGKNGHIAIRTNSIQRAIAYLKRNGIEVDMSTVKPEKGPMIAVYLKNEIGGFAVHLLQKK